MDAPGADRKEAPIDLEVGLGWALLTRGRRARALRRLLSEKGGVDAVLALSVADAAAIAGEDESVVAPLLSPTEAPGVAAQSRLLAGSGARLVGLTDPEYPELLRELPDPPVVLFVRGAPLPGPRAIAVVGSRRATRNGLEAARQLAAGLASAGVEVVSGFARGIDAAAHRAVLDAGGITHAVLGCGVDVLYPPEQKGLLAELLSHGTALSELPMGTTPQPFHFPVRNRLIAGLSRIVLVVEAAEKSGSLITARYAVDYGRDVAAVPGSILSPLAAGSNALLKDGAILVRTVADLLSELPGGPGTSRPDGDALPDLDPDARAVWEALDGAEGRDGDELELATSLGASRLAAALLRLELEGLVEALPGAVFVRSARRGS
jgi:DNA processing protein